MISKKKFKSNNKYQKFSNMKLLLQVFFLNFDFEYYFIVIKGYWDNRKKSKKVEGGRGVIALTYIYTNI